MLFHIHVFQNKTYCLKINVYYIQQFGYPINNGLSVLEAKTKTKTKPRTGTN